MARALAGRHELRQVPSTFQLHHFGPHPRCRSGNATKSNEDLTSTRNHPHANKTPTISGHAESMSWNELPWYSKMLYFAEEKHVWRSFSTPSRRSVATDCTGGEKGTNMLHLSRKVSADAAPLLALPTQNDVLHPQMLPLPPKKCAGRSMSPTTHEFQTLRLPRIPRSWRSYSTACRRSFSTAFRRSFSTPLPTKQRSKTLP